ncbi:LLM class flavin-dependent oxidoreductase [Flavobacterium sp. I3-2]|uniref:LLM class flavin-dependent oxidoreductase n=1 Tax=Flavobacterium sp. I3-2 TaxID=2748319 RepID=UPI0015ACD4B6|nr:LLM class flavin-dependent oxidoreductase [Flavobacterium sp. I3-2]
MVKYSFLDLAYVTEDATIAETFDKTLESAKCAELLGFERFWLAEHHNMDGVASSATSILIGFVAANTKTIRVGSGGLMLPNHSPLVVAEQFGTLATLYPNRIDLGLGRAPGTDQLTASYIRPDFYENAQNFPKNVSLLQQFLSSNNRNSKVRAIPGEGVDIPIWILGSSTESSVLAASFGLPYAFASHFAPGQIKAAFNFYKENFQVNDVLEKPYNLACINVIVADSLQEAQKLATSFYMMFLGIIRNERKKMQPPIDSMDNVWSVNEEAMVRQMLTCSFIGTKEIVKRELTNFLEKIPCSELMMSCPVYDLEARKLSMTYFSEIMAEINE